MQPVVTPKRHMMVVMVMVMTAVVMVVMVIYHGECSEIHRWLNDQRYSHHLPAFWLS